MPFFETIALICLVVALPVFVIAHYLSNDCNPPSAYGPRQVYRTRREGSRVIGEWVWER